MKILETANKKKSRKVKKSEIGTVVAKCLPGMHLLCYEPIGQYGGALAVAHCQVEEKDHLKFFVTKEGEAVVNPQLEPDGETKYSKEGCLAFPNKKETKVLRYKRGWASYTSVKFNEDGGLIIEKIRKHLITGKKCFVFQHEIDHFNAKTIY